MADKFEAVDPLGRTVICTEDTWRWHVVDFHKEMEGDESLVIQTIEQPTLGVFRDADFENRDVYYRKPPGKAYYIKVVVEFNEPQSGTLITAFRADTPKAGEMMVWPISTL